MFNVYYISILYLVIKEYLLGDCLVEGVVGVLVNRNWLLREKLML